MKILHLADLHLGKKLSNYSLLEDQEYVLNEAIDLVKKEKIETVLLAGDIYDNGQPSGETTKLFDSFISNLFNIGVHIYLIPGNHDNADKLHFASNILSKSNIHFVTNLEDSFKSIYDDGINFYLLPYTYLTQINQLFYPFDEKKLTNLTDAFKEIIKRMNVDESKTNVLLMHQSVLPSNGILKASGSETALSLDSQGQVGGSDVIPSSLFSSFDYVALGHIHKAMDLTSKMRYPGSLLKYHKKEANNKKSFTIVEINSKNVTKQLIPIKYKRDVKILKGTFDQLIKEKDDNYIYFELEDRNYILDAMEKLKNNYRYALELSYPFISSSLTSHAISIDDIKKMSKEDIFSMLYKKDLGREISSEELEIMKKYLIANEDK